MKQTKHLLGMAAALLLAASCSSDEPVDPKPQVADKDQTRYLSVAISSPAGTRAYEDGTTEESYVDKLYFYFFDKDGNPTGQMKTFNQKDGEFKNDPSNNVTRFWQSVVPVELVQGQTLPSYVMCFVNPLQVADLDNKTLNEIEAIRRERVHTDAGHFPMSNSVYYGTDPVTGKEGRLMATPISGAQLFEKRTDAETATSGIVEIYVERYAAKIGLTLDPGKIEKITVVDPDGTEHELQFVPEYWRPNAIDKQIYATKTFGLNPDGTFTPGTAPSKETMDKAFSGGGMPQWNDPAAHRCFWSCSPAYYANSYPRVSDDVRDVDATEVKAAYPLDYFSYTQISTDPKSIAWDETSGFTAEAGKGKYFYSRETTTSIQTINDAANGNPVASVASIVIVGKYSVDGAAAAGNFYIGAKDENDRYAYYADHAAARSELMKRQGFLFADDQGTQRLDDEDMFVVEHPKAGVRGEIPVAGRYVTLQLSSAAIAGANAYFYGDKGDGTKGYIAVAEENIDEVNRQLWQQVGTLSVFHEGLAFYNIPIHHLGFGKNGTGGADEFIKDGAYVWENMRRGDLGVVRNHVYNISVSGIKGLATGLRSTEQPIVPPKSDVNYYVSAKLNILAWNIVPTQEVEL